MTSSNAVSVIVPTWNCAPFLRPCVDSLLAQTHAPEIIVVDDGSTDGTGEVLSQFKDRIRWIRHQRRRGANAARNTGLRSAAGDWIIFADADAEYRPDWIARMLEAGRDDPAVGVVYSGFKRRFDNGREHFFPSREWDPAALWWENYIAMPSLVRREALPDEGLDESSDVFDDWQLWLHLCGRGWTGSHVACELFTALVREQGKSRTFQRDPAARASVIAALRRDHAGIAGADHAVSVVIPACGSEDLTVRCLDHLHRYCGVPFVVYYVDNGSGEVTVQDVSDAADARGLPIHILRNGCNAGFTDAVNRGMRAAGSRHVLVLNNDCFVGPDCVERLWWSVQRQPNCAAAGPLSGDWGAHSLRHTGAITRVGASPSIAKHLHDPLIAARLLDQRERYESVGLLAFFCTMLNRQAVRRFGLLDDRFPTGLGADDEWCWRVRRSGWRCLRVLNAFAAHLHSASFRRLGLDYGQLHREAWRTLREVVAATHG